MGLIDTNGKELPVLDSNGLPLLPNDMVLELSTKQVHWVETLQVMTFGFNQDKIN